MTPRQLWCSCLSFHPRHFTAIAQHSQSQSISRPCCVNTAFTRRRSFTTLSTAASATVAPPPPPPVTPLSQHVELTDAAAARIEQLRAKHGPNIFLRLSIDTGGCSGLSYKFELDRQGPVEDDRVFSHNQGAIIIDALSLEHLNGSIIDYKSKLERSGFEVVTNPNALGRCGCGTSFQPKHF